MFASFVYETFTLYSLVFQTNSTRFKQSHVFSPNPRSVSSSSLGSSSFARHYSRNRFFFLFLWVLRCFSSPRSLLIYYFTHIWINRVLPLFEFPHSDICGSIDICSSPQLIAACHVLLRFLVPRHPSYALSSLTFRFSFFSVL